MDLDDLFDLGDDLQNKVKLKADAPRHVHIDLALSPAEPSSAQIADTLDIEPGDCPYGGSEESEAQDGDLDVDIATRAKLAAQAHDAFAASKAAYDVAKARIQLEVDAKLADLRENMSSAREAEAETLEALRTAMEKGGITTIPMTDRPDIKLKVRKGTKKGITRGWLVDPENVAVKAYEEALAGTPTIKTGKEFAGKVWDAQPKSEDSHTVTIPDVYEDEPE